MFLRCVIVIVTVIGMSLVVLLFVLLTKMKNNCCFTSLLVVTVVGCTIVSLQFDGCCLFDGVLCFVCW